MFTFQKKKYAFFFPKEQLYKTANLKINKNLTTGLEQTKAGIF